MAAHAEPPRNGKASGRNIPHAAERGADCTWSDTAISIAIQWRTNRSAEQRNSCLRRQRAGSRQSGWLVWERQDRAACEHR